MAARPFRPVMRNVMRENAKEKIMLEVTSDTYYKEFNQFDYSDFPYQGENKILLENPWNNSWDELWWHPEEKKYYHFNYPIWWDVNWPGYCGKYREPLLASA